MSGIAHHPLFTFYGISRIPALSLNLEYDYTGLPKFDKVFFYSIGAYNGVEDFIPLITFNVLAMVILGGAANHRGVALGAFVMTVVDRFSRTSFLAMFGIQPPFDINFLRYVILGALLVGLIMFRPQGLLPEGPVRTPAMEVFRRRGSS